MNTLPGSSSCRGRRCRAVAPHLLSLALLCTACTWELDQDSNPGGDPEHSRDHTPEQQDLDWLATQDSLIRTLAGVPACNGPRDCLALPMGDKPCGGPWRYLIVSRNAENTPMVEAMVMHYNDINAAMNERWGWGSDCEVLMPPDLICQNGICTEAPR